MRIGVISDTHGYFDPRLPTLLAGVDSILHAGDAGSRLVLEQLQAIAPLAAVRGNIDPAVLDLPSALTRQFGAIGIHLLHQLPESPRVLREWAEAPEANEPSSAPYRRFLRSFPRGCRVVVFGHTHDPLAQILGGKLFFNPGSAGKQRFSLPRCCGLLEVSRGCVRASFLALEEHDQPIGKPVRLPIDGPA